MVERLRCGRRADILTGLEALSVAYIQLANWSVDKYRKETSKHVVYTSYCEPANLFCMNVLQALA